MLILQMSSQWLSEKSPTVILKSNGVKSGVNFAKKHQKTPHGVNYEVLINAVLQSFPNV